MWNADRTLHFKQRARGRQIADDAIDGGSAEGDCSGL